MTDATPDDDGLIAVRATINLTDLRPGQIVRVDPTSPYIKGLLEKRRLVPLTEPLPPVVR